MSFGGQFFLSFDTGSTKSAELPLRIRSDNGLPFATRGIGGLSQLSACWVKLGILPERIEPGKPQQNDRHERMHRTLKLEAVENGSQTDAQQAAFDRWRHDFNHERPHEALDDRVPADVYQPSHRPFPGEPGAPKYPDGIDLRRVETNGTMNFLRARIHMGPVLRREIIGIEPIDDDRFQLWFGPIYLGLVTALGRGEVSFDRNIPQQ